MDYTPNYNLKKLQDNDNADLPGLCDNFNIIDEVLTPAVDQAAAPPATNQKGKLAVVLGWLANMIKAITGKANWWEAPAKNLQDLYYHILNGGHEWTRITNKPLAYQPMNHAHGGASTEADGFMSAADKLKLNNATANASGGTLILRDAAGRAMVANPTSASDIANKSYVDGAVAAKEERVYWCGNGTWGDGILSVTNSKIIALFEGLGLSVKMPDGISPADPSLKIGVLDAKPILKPDGTTPGVGRLKGICNLRYDGSNFYLVGEGGDEPFELNATVAITDNDADGALIAEFIIPTDKYSDIIITDIQYNNLRFWFNFSSKKGYLYLWNGSQTVYAMDVDYFAVLSAYTSPRIRIAYENSVLKLYRKGIYSTGTWDIRIRMVK